MYFSLEGLFARSNLWFYGPLAVLVLVAWVWPLAGNRLFTAVEAWGARMASHRTACCIATAILLVALRLVLWPIDRAPVPRVSDEFSYLLAADTFANGRVTNPTPPQWIFFETIHVNVRPTYMSKYPPGQGAALAVGELLGHPWIGVLLSVALMCSLATWMLQGWMPARWALLGGLLAVLRFFFAAGYEMNYWLESYWGGAVPAIGGALALGALPRMLRQGRWRDGILFGTGVAVMANSRPYEGLVMCVPLAGALLWRLWRHRGAPTAVNTIRLLAPATSVLFLAGAFMAYYNWRGTGNALLMPYAVNDREYMSTPQFAWESVGPPREYRNVQLSGMYNGWCRQTWRREQFRLSWDGIHWGLLRKLEVLQAFYLPGLMGLVILVTWRRLLRNRKAVFLSAVCASVTVGLVPVVWFQRHYAAPMLAAAFGLSLMGLRYLRTWKPGGRPLGVGLSRAFVVLTLFFIPVNLRFAYQPVARTIQNGCSVWACDRDLFDSRLAAGPGRHLILVRYDEKHDPGQEWVYNKADIEQAKVVWAREIPGQDMRPLLDHFKDRKVWLVEPGLHPTVLQDYTVPAAP